MSETTSTDKATEQPHDTRSRILAVALQLFADKGYDATSMREIAERLNISKPALYYHFDSKEDIVRGVLADTQAHLAELVAWARTRKPTAATRREALGRWADIVQRHGLAVFRFMMASRLHVEALHKDSSEDMATLVRDLCAAVLPEDATVPQRVRMRLALMTVNMAGVVGLELDAPEDELLGIAREVALELLP